ncbi:hypothetical protein L7F22_012925 [Adiantum nelumboides]|nr:hypothetical protein [Adiantum nelumboides]
MGVVEGQEQELGQQALMQAWMSRGPAAGLVKASSGAGDPAMQMQMALALAPKIGVDQEQQAALGLPAPAKEFDAIFYPGGHGPLIGLPESKESQDLIRAFYESNRVVSAVCHAPAVLTDVKLSDGSYLVNGRSVTSFTNEEEEQAGLTNNVPWLVETRLQERGAKFNKGKPWTENVVVDKDSSGRILITGANPQSGAQLAKVVLKSIAV